DSTLAGYLLARTDEDEPHVALARAVAYGAAAASLRGTGVPTPEDARIDSVTVTPRIAPQAKAHRRQNSRHLNQYEGAAPEAEEAGWHRSSQQIWWHSTWTRGRSRPLSSAPWPPQSPNRVGRVPAMTSPPQRLRAR